MRKLDRSLCQIDFKLQQSNALHSLGILRDLFVQGKTEFVMKVLIQLNKALLADPSLVSSLANFTLKELVDEVSTLVETQAAQSVGQDNEPASSGTKATASAAPAKK